MAQDTVEYREYKVAGRNQIDLGESGVPGKKDIAWPGATVWLQTSSREHSHFYTPDELQLQLNKETIDPTGNAVTAAIHPGGVVAEPPAKQEPKTAAELAIDEATNAPQPVTELMWADVRNLGAEQGKRTIAEACANGTLTDRSINSLRRGLASCDWTTAQELIDLLKREGREG